MRREMRLAYDALTTTLKKLKVRGEIRSYRREVRGNTLRAEILLPPKPLEYIKIDIKL